MLKRKNEICKNSEKTRNEELDTSYACEVDTASEEFLLSYRQYELHARRHYDREAISYQIRQSFKLGEVTAEEANRIGYQTATALEKVMPREFDTSDIVVRLVVRWIDKC